MVVGVGVATALLLVVFGNGLFGLLFARAGEASKSAEAVITEVAISTDLFFRFMRTAFCCGLQVPKYVNSCLHAPNLRFV